MCSVVGLIGKAKDFKKYLSINNLNKLKTILDVKGGDEYSAIIIKDEYFKRFDTLNFKDLNTHFNSSIFNENDYIKIMLFSRLTPEMEKENTVFKQPYFNEKENTIVAIHGTIPKAEEFCDVNIDTEIFKYKPLKDSIEYTEKVGGKISLLSFNITNFEINTYHNGLGMYNYDINSLEPNTDFNISMLTNIDLEPIISYDYKQISQNIFSNDNNIYYISNKRKKENNVKLSTIPKKRIISLFSGGLDITCSTLNVLDNMFVDSIDLWYFDWGSNARVGEIKALHNFYELLNYIYDKTNIDLYYEELDISTIISNTLQICTGKSTTRLSDSKSKGAGSHEAEAAISYVPFRNTLLLTLAAAKAEQLYPNDECIFIIGANLSEGMVYSDNSETFTNSFDSLIKVGGQRTHNFSVMAPFVNKTKTEMVKIALENKYDLSTVFSCYFPDSKSKECGKCGSCLLKKQAFKRAQEKLNIL